MKFLINIYIEIYYSTNKDHIMKMTLKDFYYSRTVCKGYF